MAKLTTASPSFHAHSLLKLHLLQLLPTIFGAVFLPPDINHIAAAVRQKWDWSAVFTFSHLLTKSSLCESGCLVQHQWSPSDLFIEASQGWCPPFSHSVHMYSRAFKFIITPTRKCSIVSLSVGIQCHWSPHSQHSANALGEKGVEIK